MAIGALMGVAAGLSLASGVGRFFSIRQAARAQERASKYTQALAENRAIALEQKANLSAAIAQRAAISERRAGRVLESTALARAAASGADVSSPGITAVIGDIDREMELRVLTRLYEGVEAEKGLRYEALLARKEGENFRWQGKVARKLGFAEANLALLKGVGGAIPYGIQAYKEFSQRPETPPPLPRRKPTPPVRGAPLPPPVASVPIAPPRGYGAAWGGREVLGSAMYLKYGEPIGSRYR